jgi:hypothetical protein
MVCIKRCTVHSKPSFPSLVWGGSVTRLLCFSPMPWWHCQWDFWAISTLSCLATDTAIAFFHYLVSLVSSALTRFRGWCFLWNMGSKQKDLCFWWPFHTHCWFIRAITNNFKLSFVTTMNGSLWLFFRKAARALPIFIRRRKRKRQRVQRV